MLTRRTWRNEKPRPKGDRGFKDGRRGRGVVGNLPSRSFSLTTEPIQAGVSFPELLQTRGQYQMKPELPFVPGSEVGGIVREIHGDPDGASRLKAGDRVAAFCMLGAWAEQAVAPAYFTFKIPDELVPAEPPLGG